MARRKNMMTGFLGDLIDDTKAFVDDLIDRAKDVEEDLRDTVRDATDDSGRTNGDLASSTDDDADLAAIRLHLATLRTRIDELAALQGQPMEPDGIIVPSTTDVQQAAAQAEAAKG